jgi:hypothetical protein
VGEDSLEKNLDRFLISENLMDFPLQFRQWVASGGESDHFPIWLEIAGGPNKLSSPLKFNPYWISYESFKI